MIKPFILFNCPELWKIHTSRSLSGKNRFRKVFPWRDQRRLEWNQAWSASVWRSWRTVLTPRGPSSLPATVPALEVVVSQLEVCQEAVAISVALNYDRLGLRFLVRPAASEELAVVALPAPLPAAPDDTRLNFSSFFSYIDARCVRTNYTFKDFASFIWFFFFFNGLSYLHGLWARMTGSWGVATALQQPLQDVDDHWSNI